MRLILAVLALASAVTLAFARDSGQWSGIAPEIRDWFKSLTNQHNEICCDWADGARVDDPDWRIETDGTYSVFLDHDWRHIDPKNVVKATNRIGYPVVWVYPVHSHEPRCFMPGTNG